MQVPLMPLRYFRSQPPRLGTSGSSRRGTTWLLKRGSSGGVAETGSASCGSFAVAAALSQRNKPLP
jgi:hypothetical protein